MHSSWMNLASEGGYANSFCAAAVSLVFFVAAGEIGGFKFSLMHKSCKKNSALHFFKF